MRGRTAGSLVMLALVIAALAGGRSVPASGAPAPDPGDFDQPMANPYFPLVPGTVTRYRGLEDGERFREKVRVTSRTRTIQGIATIIVIDVLFVDGRLAERTEDWYAGDDLGNVWYFGEDTAEYDAHGEVISTSGSWEAGVDGAVAGIIMPADPSPTDAYRQEFYRGEAEDQAWIVQRHARVRVPLRAFRHVVRSFEWSRLEPHVLVEKMYARGVGIVRERVLAGGIERLELVGIERP